MKIKSPIALSALLLVVLPFLLSTVPGCGGRGGGGSTLGLTRVQADESRSAKATVGAQGGTVTATDGNGVTYTLTVPPNALPKDTEITLIPVTSIQDVGFSGGLAGAVHMLPEGLQFSQPAELKLQLPAGTDVKALKAFGYTGDGQEPHLQPATPAGTILTIPILHFSGAGAGGGEPQLPQGTSNTLAASHLSTLIQIGYLDEPPIHVSASFIDHLRGWYTSTIKPGLEAIPSLNDDADIYNDLRWYQVWRHYANGTGIPAGIRAEVVAALAPERAEAANIAADSLRRLIASFNELCTQESDLRHAKKAIYYAGWAQSLGLATQSRQLDQATILDDLCVEVKLGVEFPDNLGAGESGHLVVRAGYSINGTETKYDKVLAVTVIPDFATDNEQRGGLVNDGQHETFEGNWVRASGANPLRLHVIARFTDPDLLDVFGEAYEVSGGGSAELTGVYTGTGGFVNPTSGVQENLDRMQWEVNDRGDRYTLNVLSDRGNGLFVPFMSVDPLGWTPPTFEGSDGRRGRQVSGTFKRRPNGRLYIEVTVIQPSESGDYIMTTTADKQ
jgi:hypothetical protein